MKEKTQINDNEFTHNKQHQHIHGENCNHGHDEEDSIIDELADEIKAKDEEIKNLNEKLLRLAAELENTRRKANNELENTRKFAVSDFASDLTLVVEDFFLALDNSPEDQSDNVKNFVDGVEMTKNELIKIFEKNNIKRIWPIGEKMDHNYHQVISQINSDKEKDVVIQVIRAGYAINGRVLKPAMVVVSNGNNQNK